VRSGHTALVGREIADPVGDYLARNIGRFEEINAVWDVRAVPGHTPGQATVHSKLVRPLNLVEIAVVAAARD
jgi:hypothetical protein